MDSWFQVQLEKRQTDMAAQKSWIETRDLWPMFYCELQGIANSEKLLDKS